MSYLWTTVGGGEKEIREKEGLLIKNKNSLPGGSSYCVSYMHIGRSHFIVLHRFFFFLQIEGLWGLCNSISHLVSLCYVMFPTFLLLFYWS